MKEALPIDKLEAMANVEVGEALRLTRLHYGQSLSDVESALRIRACQIDAIEQGDTSKLPGRVYAIGFVRSYAEYLGIDGGKTVQLFIAQYMDGHTKSTLSFPTPAYETKTPAIWLVVVSAVLAILFFVFIGGKSDVNNKPELMQIQDVPEDIKTHITEDILIKSVDVDIDEQIEDMGESDENLKIGIILNITNDSWVEIKNGEMEVIVSKILRKGDQYFVPDRPDLSMSIGNAANVEIILGGQALKPLGGLGDVRRNIPLNSEYLKTLDFVEKP